jgi:death-on-curing protein
MIYLQKDEIIWINRKTIEKHGGNFLRPTNILNESPLDYTLEIVEAEMFGEPLYPHIWDKAAVYFHSIIMGHIFQDGTYFPGWEQTNRTCICLGIFKIE